MVEVAGVGSIWQEVLLRLASNIDKPTFETWLKSTIGVELDDTRFVVQVPTPFAIAWLERRMYQKIQKTLQEVSGRILDVQFQVGNSDPNSQEYEYLPPEEIDTDRCEISPCLKDHWTEKHQNGVLQYIRDEWDVWDATTLPEVWTFPLIEDALRSVVDMRGARRRLTSTSGYFIKAIELIAAKWGMSQAEINEKHRLAAMPAALRPKPREDVA